MKNLEFGYLLEFYKSIIPQKQAQMIDLYYNEDLSLAEIADTFGITRQGVRDNIKRGETELASLEDKLMLVKKLKNIENDLISVKSLIKHKNSQKEVLDKIDKITDNLYL